MHGRPSRWRSAPSQAKPIDTGGIRAGDVKRFVSHRFAHRRAADPAPPHRAVGPTHFLFFSRAGFGLGGFTPAAIARGPVKGTPSADMAKSVSTGSGSL